MLLGGTWVLIILLLVGVLFVAPRAAMQRVDLPVGWAAEHEVQGIYTLVYYSILLGSGNLFCLEDTAWWHAWLGVPVTNA